MTARRVVLGAALVAALAVPTILHGQAQQRVVFASAVDEKGAPVEGLGASDFVIREDKVAREVLTAAPAHEPMQIALLIDNSQAADPYIRDLRQGATAFIQAIAADPTARHEIAVITIGERPTINTDYTTDISKATAGANRIFATPGSGAYLLDGIIETSRGFKKREATRPVIVAVITAGVDLSDRVYQSVLEPLRDSGATLHVVVLGRPITSDTDRMMVLDLGTRETGGRYDTVLTGTALAPRLKQIGDELTHQYKLTYARPQTLIPPERVTVSSSRPNITVRGIAQHTPVDAGRR
ncbi:MAG: hypothetical protein JSU08_04430 [Acidobacteria bacterium]|nr:hypothetical protein [Acidobacteriota bacterium]